MNKGYLTCVSFWMVFFAIMISPIHLNAKIDRLPEFLLVGAQKSGTTALFQLINQHPKVVKKNGEVHFFDINFHRGLNWYKRLFPKRPQKDHIVGDHSPYYLFHPMVPERVFSVAPKMKIIMILRNPVDRCYSHYWHNIAKKLEHLSFEEALNAEPKRLQGRKQRLIQFPFYKSHQYQHFSYLARGIYVDQIQSWLSYFPRKQILILKSQDLRKDPIRVLNKVFSFLKLKPYTVDVRNPEAHSNYPPMETEMRKKLVEYYRPYNQKLEELLGMQFNWD